MRCRINKDEEIILERLYTDVCRIVAKFHFDLSTSDDLVQDIIIKIYLKKNSFQNKSYYKTWIYAITKNHCINYLHRVYKRNSNEISLTEYFEIKDYNYSNINRNFIRDCIAKLPKRLKQPLIYYYFENLKYREIAQKLKIPIGTVKSRINTAKGILRSYIY